MVSSFCNEINYFLRFVLFFLFMRKRAAPFYQEYSTKFPVSVVSTMNLLINQRKRTVSKSHQKRNEPRWRSLLVWELLNLRAFIRTCRTSMFWLQELIALLVHCSLVPRRSPPAHSTRLGAKCRDVTEWVCRWRRWRLEIPRQDVWERRERLGTRLGSLHCRGFLMIVQLSLHGKGNHPKLRPQWPPFLFASGW